MVKRIARRGPRRRVSTTFLYYLLTIEKHQVKDYVDSYDLISELAYIQVQLSRMSVLDIGLEAHGMYMQLHLHALVRIDYNFRYSSICKHNGYRFHWARLYDKVDIDRVSLYFYNRLGGYIHKNAWDNYRQEQILDENYYRYHYGFG